MNFDYYIIKLDISYKINYC